MTYQQFRDSIAAIPGDQSSSSSYDQKLSEYYKSLAGSGQTLGWDTDLVEEFSQFIPPKTPAPVSVEQASGIVAPVQPDSYVPPPLSTTSPSGMVGETRPGRASNTVPRPSHSAPPGGLSPASMISGKGDLAEWGIWDTGGGMGGSISLPGLKIQKEGTPSMDIFNYSGQGGYSDANASPFNGMDLGGTILGAIKQVLPQLPMGGGSGGTIGGVVKTLPQIGGAVLGAGRRLAGSNWAKLIASMTAAGLSMEAITSLIASGAIKPTKRKKGISAAQLTGFTRVSNLLSKYSCGCSSRRRSSPKKTCRKR